MRLTCIVSSRALKMMLRSIRPQITATHEKFRLFAARCRAQRSLQTMRQLTASLRRRITRSTQSFMHGPLSKTDGRKWIQKCLTIRHTNRIDFKITSRFRTRLFPCISTECTIHLVNGATAFVQHPYAWSMFAQTSHLMNVSVRVTVAGTNGFRGWPRSL